MFCGFAFQPVTMPPPIKPEKTESGKVSASLDSEVSESSYFWFLSNDRQFALHCILLFCVKLFCIVSLLLLYYFIVLLHYIVYVLYVCMYIHIFKLSC